MFKIIGAINYLAVVFLKERMNKPELIALTLGVLGVMVIIRPTTEIFNPYSLLVFLKNLV